ncbi:MAG: NAD(P)H-hydrate dehydratase, partial [Lachnospiraceae bacterium]|nr:NAD(P)H-hydrate dehydratase [Lachnospiraceae bacterium]
IPSAYVGSGQSAEHSCIDKKALAAGIDWADYIIAGPGLSRNPQAKELIRVLYSEECRKLLRDKKMLILDADALNLIAESGLEPGILCPNTVITPHVGEMSRLCSLTIGEIKQDPEKAAADYCSRHGVTVVLKDAVTVVAEPGTDARGGQGAVRVLRIDSGCGAMAKAGSGDVLCGFLAGTAAVLKGNIRDAVPIGVWLHGCAGSIAAGEKGCHSILAGDIADAAGEAIRHC